MFSCLVLPHFEEWECGVPLTILLLLFIFIYLFGCAGSQLWHGGSSVAAYQLLVAACGIQFPNQMLKRGPLHQECGVLATGPPGKSLTHPSLAPQIPEPSGSPQATQGVGLKVKHRTICQGSSHPQEKSPFLSLFEANCFSCCFQYFPR